MRAPPGTYDDGRGGFGSHFELYHRAMARCGADTAPVSRFLAALRQGSPVRAALQVAGAAACVETFVGRTFDLIEGGSLCSVAAAFTFGREDLLPGLFQRIVDELDAAGGGVLEEFRHYLGRHIGLDGGEHGPMAVRLVASLCGSDESRWQAAEDAAVSALEARRDLWDGVHTAMRRAR